MSSAATTAVEMSSRCSSRLPTKGAVSALALVPDRAMAAAACDASREHGALNQPIKPKHQDNCRKGVYQPDASSLIGRAAESIRP